MPIRYFTCEIDHDWAMWFGLAPPTTYLANINNTERPLFKLADHLRVEI